MNRKLSDVIKLSLACVFLAGMFACGRSGNTGTPGILISNETLSRVLKGTYVSQDQTFPGLAAYIDTRVAYSAADVFCGLPLSAEAKQVISENYNRFLKVPDSVGLTFYQGDTQASGLVTDATLHKLTATTDLISGGVPVGTTTVTWTFSDGVVQRTSLKHYTSGELATSSYQSTVRYSYNIITGVTSALFSESDTEITTVANSQTHALNAQYSGTVNFARSNVSTDGSLIAISNSTFTQIHSERDFVAGSSQILNGTATMTNESGNSGALSFIGKYSFDLPVYNTVAGSISLSAGSYGKSYVPAMYTYSNSNSVTTASITLLSGTDYLSYPSVVNSPALVGTWSGTFTDSCSNDVSGNMILTIDPTIGLWSGISADLGRIYGVDAVTDGSGIHLTNNRQSWGNTSQITATDANGSWNYNGCSGSFHIQKVQ